MALTQMQLIQSLGEAMAWFERELQWGVAPTELRHLCGRIGELYAALVSNGQLAQQVNQRGYDVVGGNGERISVKTTAIENYSGCLRWALLCQKTSFINSVPQRIPLQNEKSMFQAGKLVPHTLSQFPMKERQLKA